ncbi:MAG: IPExxxVDY family protein [Bacteroidales bacterium]|nr:IPExxxVDY family protein [Bacteroidales bacterium]
MNGKAKITRHAIIDSGTPDFIFLGIVSAEPDYRLSVMLNRHLAIDLRHSQTDIREVRGKDETTWSRFTTTPLTLSLVSNKSRGKILIRKLKNIDYLLVIHNADDGKNAGALAASVRKCPEVTAVFLFESLEIGDRNLPLLVQ